MRYPKLEHFQEPNVITTTADFIFSWARSHSVFPFTYGLACCENGRLEVVLRRVAYDPTPALAAARERGMPGAAAYIAKFS